MDGLVHPGEGVRFIAEEQMNQIVASIQTGAYRCFCHQWLRQNAHHLGDLGTAMGPVVHRGHPVQWWYQR